MGRHLIDQERALRLVDAHRSARWHNLNRLESYAKTTQYEGRQDWFAGGDDAKPLLERAPCIQYPIVQSAIDSNCDLLLGSERFPNILAPEQEALNGFLGALMRRVRFRSAAIEVFAQAQSCGTAVSVYGVNRGRLFIESVPAKWCTPKFDKDGAVIRLEIKYPYIEQREIGGGKLRSVAMLYRRLVDEEEDVTYLPAEASEHDGVEPKWQRNNDISYQHGLGHCPVIWYAHMRGCSAVNQIDGRALHANVLGEIFALDVALSQRHRAALMAGDPQWVEIGADEGPAATGRSARESVYTTPHGGEMGPGNLPTGRFVSMSSVGGDAARKKGVGTVWRYENPETKVQMHTLPGDALKAIDEHARDLRSKIAEALAVVFLDPESIRFASALSGKAMQALRQRQFSRVDQYRVDFGDGWLIPQLQGLLRVVRRYGADVKCPGSAQAQALLTQLEDAPELELEWPPYIDSSPEEELKTVELASYANEKGLITRKTAVAKIAEQFKINDVDSYMSELDVESERRRSEIVAQNEAEQATLHALARANAAQTQNPAGAAESPSAGANSNGGARRQG